MKKLNFNVDEIVSRLSRAEGQVRSLKDRFAQPHEPREVLQQLRAARNAIDQVSRLAMLEYIKSDLSKRGDPVKNFEPYSELVKKYGL